MAMRRLVTIPSLATLVRESPGFLKKGLSSHKLDLLGLCEFGCRYCSSNTGNYLRINQKRFADLTEEQLGERVLPSQDPSLVFRYEGVVEQLDRELSNHKAGYGRGDTLMFSMLVDGFSPYLVTSGITEPVLTMLVDKTQFQIRVLTKNAIVGSSHWIEFFLRHRDRFMVGLSIGSLDNGWARQVEVGTSQPTARLRALRALQDAGVRTYGMTCPIFPDVVEAGQIDNLIDQVRPDRVEDFWVEPFNSRANWEHVRAGYAEDSPGWRWLTEVYEHRNMAEWSRYATALYKSFKVRAVQEGWGDKLHYLLYEHHITAEDARSFCDMRGLMLQSPKAEDGLSKNPQIRKLQEMTGHPDQWDWILSG